MTVAGIDSNKHKMTLLLQRELVMIRDISQPEQTTKCKFKFSFILETKNKEYKLFAPTIEERTLWIESLHMYMGVPVVVCRPKATGLPPGRDNPNVFKVEMSLATNHPTLEEQCRKNVMKS